MVLPKQSKEHPSHCYLTRAFMPSHNMVEGQVTMCKTEEVQEARTLGWCLPWGQTHKTAPLSRAVSGSSCWTPIRF